MGLTQPIMFEEGDRLYLVGPLAPQEPSVEQIEEYAYGRDLLAQQKAQAPNEHLAWFGGHYVSADTPNLNGAAWTSGELALKSLTPMFMPVTVMHDPRTAVGLIADARLLTPEQASVPRSKIETALALWRHRFPEAVEEAQHNYEQGTLMQSMECLAPDYSCSECGMVFHKLPGRAERANWCAHLQSMDDPSVTRTLGERAAFRFLRNVTFTGTGLIFGSRGARGADPEAHLADFQAEVAEHHQRVHRGSGARRSHTRKMDDITIPKSEYDELRSRPSRDELDEVKAKLDTAEQAAEKAEADKAKAEEKIEAAEAKAARFEEQANAARLRDERWAKLGKGFTAKLGDKTKARLHEQAGAMSDDDWTARLEELAEAYGVEATAEGDDKGEGEEFSAEEVASSVAGRTGGKTTNGEVKPAERRQVLRGLVGAKK